MTHTTPRIARPAAPADQETVNLSLTGHLLPGFEAAQVAPALATLLKVSQEQAHSLLRGSATLIRKALPAAQVPQYLQALNRFGVEVQASPSDQPPRPEPMPVAEPAPPIPSAKPDATGHPPSQPDPLPWHKVLTALFGRSWQGRSGRMAFAVQLVVATVMLPALINTVLQVPPILLAAIGAGQSTSFLIRWLGFLSMLPVSWLIFRACALRLQDMNLSPRWLPLFAPGTMATQLVWFIMQFHSNTLVLAGLIALPFLLIPYLILLLRAGSSGHNSYGPPPAPVPSWFIVGPIVLASAQLQALWMALFVVGMAAGSSIHK